MITRIGGTNRYSDIVINDNIAYLSGVVPTKDGSVYEQTKEILTLIEEHLISVKSSKKSLIQMTIYLNDEKTYEEMNTAFDEWIPKGCAPARATLGNIKFPNPLWKVEIVAQAYIPKIQTSYIYNNIDYIR